MFHVHITERRDRLVNIHVLYFEVMDSILSLETVLTKIFVILVNSCGIVGISCSFRPIIIV